MSREWRLYFEDILEATRRVMRYTAGYDAKLFRLDERTRDAVLHNLEIVGEAAKRLPEEVRGRYPSADWRRICGFRDIVAHAYFGIDETILWDIVSNKVPQLLAALDDRNLSSTAPDFLRTVCVCRDRYGGVYSGNEWWAIAQADFIAEGKSRLERLWEHDSQPNGDDSSAAAFWANPPEWAAAAASPDEAVLALWKTDIRQIYFTKRVERQTGNKQSRRDPDWPDERTPNSIYPVFVFSDRHNGAYSGAPWLAFCKDLEDAEMRLQALSATRAEADAFWAKRPVWAAAGKTPNEAVRTLGSND